jgi:hypothetical protein
MVSRFVATFNFLFLAVALVHAVPAPTFNHLTSVHHATAAHVSVSDILVASPEVALMPELLKERHMVAPQPQPPHGPESDPPRFNTRSRAVNTLRRRVAQPPHHVRSHLSWQEDDSADVSVDEGGSDDQATDAVVPVDGDGLDSSEDLSSADIPATDVPAPNDAAIEDNSADEDDEADSEGEAPSSNVQADSAAATENASDEADDTTGSTPSMDEAPADDSSQDPADDSDEDPASESDVAPSEDDSADVTSSDSDAPGDDVDAEATPADDLVV